MGLTIIIFLTIGSILATALAIRDHLKTQKNIASIEESSNRISDIVDRIIQDESKRVVTQRKKKYEIIANPYYPIGGAPTEIIVRSSLSSFENQLFQFSAISKTETLKQHNLYFTIDTFLDASFSGRKKASLRKKRLAKSNHAYIQNLEKLYA